MGCFNCGADNRGGAKLCNDCSAPMPVSCPRCGAANRPGAKFWDECAASLGDGRAASDSVKSTPARLSEQPRRMPSGADTEGLPDGERKTVTALFADIKGSMELIEELDPEEAHAIVDPAQADDRCGPLCRLADARGDSPLWRTHAR
jgi:Double zinc ribbon